MRYTILIQWSDEDNYFVVFAVESIHELPSLIVVLPSNYL